MMNNAVRLLTEKAGMLASILAETERQASLIAAGDMEGLCASLDARQSFMDGVDNLDGRIRALGGAADAPGDEGVQKLRSEIAALLRDILIKDDENRKNAGEQALSMMSGMKQVSAQRSMMAYMPAGDRGSKFVDREG